MSHHVVFDDREEVWVGFGFGSALQEAFRDSPWAGGVVRYDYYDTSREDGGLRKLEGYKPSEVLPLLEDAFVRLPVEGISPEIAKGILRLFQELISITKEAIRDGDRGEWRERGF